MYFTKFHHNWCFHASSSRDAATSNECAGKERKVYARQFEVANYKLTKNVHESSHWCAAVKGKLNMKKIFIVNT